MPSRSATRIWTVAGRRQHHQAADAFVEAYIDFFPGPGAGLKKVIEAGKKVQIDVDSPQSCWRTPIQTASAEIDRLVWQLAASSSPSRRVHLAAAQRHGP